MGKFKLFIEKNIRFMLLFFVFLVFSAVLASQLGLNLFKIPANFGLTSLLSPSQTTYTSDSTISLSNQQLITTASLFGTAKLNSPDALVRVLLVDDKGNEYLVYEANSSIDDINTPLALNNECQETCQFGPVKAASIKIKIINGSLTITSLNTSNPQIYSVSEQGASLASKKIAELQKVQAMITKKHSTWIAGETSVSNLTYTQKKKLFTNPDGTPVKDLPNLQGFEYYKGGIFKVASNNTASAQSATASATSATSGLPANWDWRNVMSADWNTSVKNQGSAGTCWAHALMGTLESQINLYYGQHLNLNLSEQQIVDCLVEPSLPYGMQFSSYPSCTDTNFCNTGYQPCVISQHGITDESCDPYVARDLWPPHCNATYICSDWQQRLWKNSSFWDYKSTNDFGTPNCPNQTMNLSENDFKKILVNKGPLNSGIVSWNHTMELVGYGGSSDWLTLQTCSKYGCSDTGCFDFDAPCTNGDAKKYCAGEEGPFDYLSATEKINCVSNHWVFSSTNTDCYSENNGQTCYDDPISGPRCVQPGSFVLPVGSKRCYLEPTMGGGNAFYQEYSPGNGDQFWIFKNSWGTDWGDNGYVKIILPLSNLFWGDLPIGPFVPPTNHSYWPAGFTNTPKPWFYNQTCANPGASQNFIIKMGFTNGQQSTNTYSCPAGTVCSSTDSSGFITCIPGPTPSPTNTPTPSTTPTPTKTPTPTPMPAAPTLTVIVPTTPTGAGALVSINGGAAIKYTTPITLAVGSTFVVRASASKTYTSSLSGTCSLASPGAVAGQNYVCSISYK